MQKLQAWMEKHMLPTANKIAQQKYLKAIATGMVAMMPVSIIASVALILISPPMASATLKPGLLQTIMIGWEWIGVTFHFPLFTFIQSATHCRPLLPRWGSAGP